MCRQPRLCARPASGLALLTTLALLALVATRHASAQTAAPPRPPPAAAPTQPDPKAKPREVELRVTSKAAADLLRPPASGAGRYDPGAIDWRGVPPWRQASFFGIRAQGQFFIYVVD